MENPRYPALRQALLPPKSSKPQPAPKPKTKGRGKRKTEVEEEEPESTPYELAEDDITNVGPVLYRARHIHDNYIMVIKTDQAIDFHRADWTSSGDDSFITLYRKTAHTWEVMDVCVEDISTVAISLNIDYTAPPKPEQAELAPQGPAENLTASLDKA